MNETQGYINEVQAMEKASEFLASESGKWFIDKILGTLNDEAVELLAKATNETERVMAQQTLLASRKPMKLLERLQKQGLLAQQSLLSLPPKEDENHEQA